MRYQLAIQVKSLSLTSALLTPVSRMQWQELIPALPWGLFALIHTDPFGI